MEVLAVVGFALLMLFGFVVVFGAPYLPTLTPQIETALDLLDLKPGQTMLEIGSGDGRVLKAAAARGWNVVGYELNPILLAFSLWHTRKYRGQVRLVWGNAFAKDWPEAAGIYIFGLNRLMPKLSTKIVQTQAKPVKLVSFGFKMPGHQPAREKNGVFLYKYHGRA
jgi:SAM-dependent methyltransferase